MQVKIKPLEWVDRGETVRDRFKASSIVGDYYVSLDRNGLFSWRLPVMRGSIVVGNVSDTKAAAEGDYERRIRSVLL